MQHNSQATAITTDKHRCSKMNKKHRKQISKNTIEHAQHLQSQTITAEEDKQLVMKRKSQPCYIE